MLFQNLNHKHIMLRVYVLKPSPDSWPTINSNEVWLQQSSMFSTSSTFLTTVQCQPPNQPLGQKWNLFQGGAETPDLLETQPRTYFSVHSKCVIFNLENKETNFWNSRDNYSYSSVGNRLQKSSFFVKNIRKFMESEGNFYWCYCVHLQKLVASFTGAQLHPVGYVVHL